MVKVILLKDVALLGQKGELKEVKDGYFRNFLLLRHLAEFATQGRIKELEGRRLLKEGEQRRKKSSAALELEKIGKTGLEFKVRTTKKGTLYRGISQKNILSQLREKGFQEVVEDWIKMDKLLKETGEYEIIIKNPAGEEARLKIEIKPE